MPAPSAHRPLASTCPRRTLAPVPPASSPPSPLRPARAAPHGRGRGGVDRVQVHGQPLRAAQPGGAVRSPLVLPQPPLDRGQRRQPAIAATSLAPVKMLRWRERAIVIERPALEQQVRAAADVRLQRAHPLDPAKAPAKRPVRSPQRALDTHPIDDRTGREGVPCARVDLIAKCHQSLTRLELSARLVLALAPQLVHARSHPKPIVLLVDEEHRLVADHMQIPRRGPPGMAMQRRALVIHDVRMTGRLPLGENEPTRTDTGRAPSGNPATGTSSRSPWRISPRGTPAESRFIPISHSFQRFALPAASPLTTVPLKAGWRRVEPALLTHHEFT